MFRKSLDTGRVPIDWKKGMLRLFLAPSIRDVGFIKLTFVTFYSNKYNFIPFYQPSGINPHSEIIVGCCRM
jgi:hypothetical protein